MINSSSEGKHGNGAIDEEYLYNASGGRHYTKLPIGRRMAKVAYGWTVTILSYLQVDV